jgi:SNF2 family DNA or RNA helicase
LLRLRLEGSPPKVLISRDTDVPEELWRALGRNIAPGQVERRSEDEVSVPLERFLTARRWLAQSLQSYRCVSEVSPALEETLNRGREEHQEVQVILDGGVESLSEAELDELLAESRFTRELLSFQRRDLREVLALSHGANFSVPGAGKTTVTYACFEAERMRGRVDRLMVVAPLSAFEAWNEEALACFDPSPIVRQLTNSLPVQVEVLLVNYQRLRSRFDLIAEWMTEGRCQLVLDEAHRMKRGHDGQWGSACLELAHLAIRRDILTGTPAPQHPTDLDALMSFLWPSNGSSILPDAARATDPPPQAMSELSLRLRPFFARTKKDELELDDPVIRVEECEMKPIQAEIYANLKTRMRRAVKAAAGERAELGRLGEIVMYLLEAAVNPALLAPAIGGTAQTPVWPPVAAPEGSTLAEQIRHYGEREVPIKFEKLATKVAENAANHRKTLIWTNFVDNFEAIGKLLAPFAPAKIHGAIPTIADPATDVVTRDSELARFRGDDHCSVLIANPAAMSEGVSLHQACHDAIYVDRTFNAGQYLQSLDRIHRLGLEPGIGTRITFLVCRDTIDEAVSDRVNIKATRLGEVLSDSALTTMALPDEELAYGQWIDPEDSDVLFAHLR